MPKKRILWVVYDFVQAGGERYVYEICKALNKEKYQVDILHVTPLGSEKAWKSEYYFQPSIDAGCTIIDFQDLLEKNKVPQKSFKERLINYIQRKLGTGDSKSLTKSDIISKFLEDYNHVNFSGVAVYKTLCIDQNIEPKNGIIHILTAQFQQSENLYGGYDKTFNYNFISSIADRSQRMDLIDFKNYQLTYFPLIFETKPYFFDREKKNDKGFKIAVFTRLSPMKPLDPYFYSLKLLVEQGVNVHLDIYGAGDPEILGLSRQLNYLYISKHVSFKGHAESIPDILKQSNIDLIWFQSNNHVPAGYAALEIAMSGLPQVFWDFNNIDLASDNESIFPNFTELSFFTEFSKKLLSSPDLAKQLGENQRKFVIENNSSSKHIHILEEIYDR